MASDYAPTQSDLSSSGSASSVVPPDATTVDASPPVGGREVAALIAWTLLADLLIFRSFGFSGPAAFFGAVPALFFLGCPNLNRGPAGKLIVTLLLAVAARLAWLGSGLTVFSGVLLVVALAMSAAGCVPFVLEGVVLAARTIGDGTKRLMNYRVPRRQEGPSKPMVLTFLSWGLPLAAFLVFGGIFVLANPDLFDRVSTAITQLADRAWLWFDGVSIWELPFCVVALLVGAGLLRPALPLLRIGQVNDAPESKEPKPSHFYVAYRNTLVTLIGLFAVYLCFEFSTLWRREFPDGFYYAGYAHQGAAWLTYALALATVVLSVIFSGSMLQDDRMSRLRRLAWGWSALNLLLALAVYNRLLIYVGYNGMTRLRTVGFFGITLVVIGFLLVLYKIGKNRGFWWLIRAQLIALVLAVVAYSLFPVDYVAHRYNVYAVRSGQSHPSVMIAVKPISDEGYFPLLEMTDANDVVIRNGIMAMLAQRQAELDGRPVDHWTEWQGASSALHVRLKEGQAAWSDFVDPKRQEDAIEAFKSHAMQWY